MATTARQATVTIKMPKSLRDALKRQADAKAMKFSGYLLSLMVGALNK